MNIYSSDVKLNVSLLEKFYQRGYNRYSKVKTKLKFKYRLSRKLETVHHNIGRVPSTISL